MVRIPGLNDNPEWGTGPVFEYKLYYRADPVDENGEEEEKDVEEDDMADDERIPLADRLCETVSLPEYKNEMLQQLLFWHVENRCSDKDEAQRMCNVCRDGIEAATTPKIFDSCIKEYWDWHQKQQWIQDNSNLA
jgi:hypothetical protein